MMSDANRVDCVHPGKKPIQTGAAAAASSFRGIQHPSLRLCLPARAALTGFSQSDLEWGYRARVVAISLCLAVMLMGLIVAAGSSNLCYGDVPYATTWRPSGVDVWDVGRVWVGCGWGGGGVWVGGVECGGVKTGHAAIHRPHAG